MPIAESFIKSLNKGVIVKSFLVSFIVLLSFSASADGVEGVWAFSGVGCRDERSLSADSHRTKSTDSNVIGLSEVTMYLEKNGRAQMIVILNGEEETMRADYSVEGNKIVFEHEAGRDAVLLVEDRILIVSEDEDDAKNCRQDEFFVYVFGKVD